MSSRLPPRYLPTLTEVVDPQVWNALASAVTPVAAAAALQSGNTHIEATFADRDALALQVIALVKPQLEAELRTVTRELFEAQYNALLPSLHLQIEDAVREALALATPHSAQPEN